MNHSIEHSNLVNSILFEVGSIPQVRLRKTVVGVFRAFENPERIVKVGTVGTPDLEGFFMGGIYLGIEVKTGNAKQTKEQKAWQKTVERFGGVYILARSVDQALTEVWTAIGLDS